MRFDGAARLVFVSPPTRDVFETTLSLQEDELLGKTYRGLGYGNFKQFLVATGMVTLEQHEKIWTAQLRRPPKRRRRKAAARPGRQSKGQAKKLAKRQAKQQAKQQTKQLAKQLKSQE